MKQRLKWRWGKINFYIVIKTLTSLPQPVCALPTSSPCQMYRNFHSHKILPSNRSLLLPVPVAVTQININWWLRRSHVCQTAPQNDRKKEGRQKTRENSLWPLKTRGLRCWTNHFQAVGDGARKVSLKEKRRTGKKATSKQCKGKNCTVGKLIQEEFHKLEKDKNKN